jgi:hypothetical protein
MADRDPHGRLAHVLGVNPEKYSLDELVDFVEINAEGDPYEGEGGVCGLSAEGEWLRAIYVPPGIADGW